MRSLDTACRAGQCGGDPDKQPEPAKEVPCLIYPQLWQTGKSQQRAQQRDVRIALGVRYEAPQGSRGEAKTASSARQALCAHPFATPRPVSANASAKNRTNTGAVEREQPPGSRQLRYEVPRSRSSLRIRPGHSTLPHSRKPPGPSILRPCARVCWMVASDSSCNGTLADMPSIWYWQAVSSRCIQQKASPTLCGPP
jgi:hypothetical protein